MIDRAGDLDSKFARHQKKPWPAWAVVSVIHIKHPLPRERMDEQIDLAIQRAGGFILAFGLPRGILGVI